MTRRAVIDGNTVVNIIEADPDFELAGFTIVDAGSAGIGWGWNGENFIEPDPVSIPLPPLEPWQFWAMLKITGREQDVKDYINVLPEPQKSIAESQLEFSLEFRRDHPLVDAVRQLLSMTEEELDTLWNQGLSLTL